jgi:hypothetical protein
MKFLPLILFSLLVIFISCNSNERINRELFDEVNKSMEVKKLSDFQITSAALEWGNELSVKAQEELMKALNQAISDAGPSGAIEFCNVNALPILKEVGEKNNVVIKRVSSLPRNPNAYPDDYEKDILSAYEYNAENNITNEPNIQKINGGEVLLYTKAIQIPGGLCLQCHGNIGKEVSLETAEKIKKHYPEDKATGYALNELRGMWSIKIPRKEVVKKL